MYTRSVCFFACLSGAALLGQDVVKVAPPGVVKVEYEDAQVRVLRFKEAVGSKLEMHSHPAYVSVSLTNDMFQYTMPDGKTSIERSKRGQSSFSKGATHAGQNTGKTAAEAIMVELKTKPSGVNIAAANDMPTVNPGMCKVELDNEYVRMIRVVVPPNGKLEMHSHASPNVVVYLSGGHVKTTSGEGNVTDMKIAPGTVQAHPAGKHSNENLGDMPTEAVLIELKTASK